MAAFILLSIHSTTEWPVLAEDEKNVRIWILTGSFHGPWFSLFTWSWSWPFSGFYPCVPSSRIRRYEVIGSPSHLGLLPGKFPASSHREEFHWVQKSVNSTVTNMSRCYSIKPILNSPKYLILTPDPATLSGFSWYYIKGEAHWMATKHTYSSRAGTKLMKMLLFQGHLGDS